MTKETDMQRYLRQRNCPHPAYHPETNVRGRVFKSIPEIDKALKSGELPVSRVEIRWVCSECGKPSSTSWFRMSPQGRAWQRRGFKNRLRVGDTTSYRGKTYKVRYVGETKDRAQRFMIEGCVLVPKIRTQNYGRYRFVQWLILQPV